MDASNFSLKDYFTRIGYDGDAEPVIGNVAEIMRRQLFSVPFENLDVQNGKIVSLVPEEIVEKILYKDRGGYCYEVNGVFAMALQAMGIPYRFVAARPMFYPARRPRTHMAVVAEVEGRRWLCDLGFGSYGIRAPMDIDLLDTDIVQDFDVFRLYKDETGAHVLAVLRDGAWANQYAFDLSPQEWIDFMPANYLNSTHPDAIFVQKLLVIQHEPEGRSILLGDSLKTVRADAVEEVRIAPDAIGALLADRFGIGF